MIRLEYRAAAAAGESLSTASYFIVDAFHFMPTLGDFGTDTSIIAAAELFVFVVIPADF